MEIIVQAALWLLGAILTIVAISIKRKENRDEQQRD